MAEVVACRPPRCSTSRARPHDERLPLAVRPQAGRRARARARLIGKARPPAAGDTRDPPPPPPPACRRVATRARARPRVLRRDVLENSGDLILARRHRTVCSDLDAAAKVPAPSPSACPRAKWRTCAAPVDDEVPQGTRTQFLARGRLGRRRGGGRRRAGRGPECAASRRRSSESAGGGPRRSSTGDAAGNVALVARFLDPGETVKSLPIDVNSVDRRGFWLMWAVRTRGRARPAAQRARTSTSTGATGRGAPRCTGASGSGATRFMRMLLPARRQHEPARPHRRTPLCCAVDARDTTALRILLDARADIDAADCVGRTPLFHAIVGCTTSEQRTKAVLEELLARARRESTSARAGQTPLVGRAAQLPLGGCGSARRGRERDARGGGQLIPAPRRPRGRPSPLPPPTAADRSHDVCSPTTSVGRARLAERQRGVHSKAGRDRAEAALASSLGAARDRQGPFENDALPRVRSKIQGPGRGRRLGQALPLLRQVGRRRAPDRRATNAIGARPASAPKDVSKDEISNVINFLDKDRGAHRGREMGELLNFIPNPEKYRSSEKVSFAGARERERAPRAGGTPSCAECASTNTPSSPTVPPWTARAGALCQVEQAPTKHAARARRRAAGRSSCLPSARARKARRSSPSPPREGFGRPAAARR